MFRNILCVVGVSSLLIGASSPVKAQSAADFAQMMAAMKKLEARVAALEAENKQSRKETAAARAESRVLRRKMGLTASTTAAPTVAAPASTAVPPRLYAMATQAPPVTPVPSWSGFYAGAGFGLGWMHANENFSETTSSISTETAPTFSDVDSQTTFETENLSGRNIGAMSNLLVGYNILLNSNFILGAQVEGGLSNTRVNLAGTGTTTDSAIDVETPSTGLPGTTTSTTTGTVTATDALDNRWLVSLLGRGGMLVDPRDLIYGLGGYTYGRFEAEGQGFGLNGGTAGAGWEREIAPGWTLRAEYRYTRFQDKSVNIAGQTTSTTTSTGQFPSTQTVNDAFAQTAHFSGVSMQSLWLGVTRYFGS